MQEAGTRLTDHSLIAKLHSKLINLSIFTDFLSESISSLQQDFQKFRDFLEKFSVRPQEIYCFCKFSVNIGDKQIKN